MKIRFLLEIAVETVEAAEAAERAGADRIELCEDLHVGGITPPGALLEATRKKVKIPIFVMIRPRAGDFVYSTAEFEEMKVGIAAAKRAGADGIVLGVLTHGALVDSKRTRELVSLSNPLPVTFHRACDETTDLPQAMEDVIQTGATRILTSGGDKTALEGMTTIARLVAAAAARIIIVPGAGINPQNISQIVTTTRAREFHSGLSSTLPYPRGDHHRFQEEIRKLIASLKSNC